MRFKAEGEAILLIGETAQAGSASRSICVSSAGARRAHRPRSISPRRTPQWRFRQEPDPSTAWSARRTTFPTAALWSRSPKWRWRPASARCSKRFFGAHPLTDSGSARSRADIVITARKPISSTSAPRQPARSSIRLGAIGGKALAIAGERPIAGCARVQEAGCRPIWRARRPRVGQFTVIGAGGAGGSGGMGGGI